MPTASVARLEKQASIDANEPLRQGIIIIEHKIRNLEKRKAKLDGYRETQKSGKDLKADQLEAVAKYDNVLAHLEFARELSKQLQGLANDSAKVQKKQARKEAAERAAQDLARTKEILIINDVLASMGNQTVRDDLLGGKSKVTLTDQELQAIDDLYEELTPKKEEPMAFLDMFQTPAETMHHLIEGKGKEAFGSTYSALKTKLMEIATSGYFDTIAAAPEVLEVPAEPESEPVLEAPAEVPSAPLEAAEPENLIPNQISQQPPQQQPMVPHTFQSNTGQPLAQVHPTEVDPSVVTAIPAQPMGNQPQQIETAYFTPSHLRVFQSGTIDFMQENEIDPPENTEAPAIPSMTFDNPSFTSNPPQMTPQIAHMPPASHQPHIDRQQPYQNQSDEEKAWNVTSGNSLELEQVTQQPQQPVTAWTSLPAESSPVPQMGGRGDDDWASQTELYSQNQSSQPNDGFITAGSNRGRGGRGRGGGGGGDRGNKGGYSGGNRGGGGGPRNSQGGRGGGGYRGEGGYRGDREGGGYRGDRDRETGGYRGDRDRETGGYRGDRDRETSGYYKDQNNGGGYQNGYQNSRSSRPPQDRPRQPQDRREGGGSGGRGGGNRPRGGAGGYRGGSNNFRQ